MPNLYCVAGMGMEPDPERSGSEYIFQIWVFGKKPDLDLDTDSIFMVWCI